MFLILFHYAEKSISVQECDARDAEQFAVVGFQKNKKGRDKHDLNFFNTIKIYLLFFTTSPSIVSTTGSATFANFTVTVFVNAPALAAL